MPKPTNIPNPGDAGPVGQNGPKASKAQMAIKGKEGNVSGRMGQHHTHNKKVPSYQHSGTV